MRVGCGAPAEKCSRTRSTPGQNWYDQKEVLMKWNQNAAKQESITCTLNPIRERGAAALDTSGGPTLKDLTLREIEIALGGSNHATILIRSDDLLTPTDLLTPAAAKIPQEGQITGALFNFHPEDAKFPHWFELRPPSTIYIQFAQDAQRVIAWLSKTHLHTLATATALLIFALATALAPPLDDNDDDDGDPDSDRIALKL